MFAELARLASELAVVALLIWLVLDPPMWTLLPLVLLFG